jgi:hypothetical protein
MYTTDLFLSGQRKQRSKGTKEATDHGYVLLNKPVTAAVAAEANQLQVEFILVGPSTPGNTTARRSAAMRISESAMHSQAPDDSRCLPTYYHMMSGHSSSTML